jgi:GH25 family lysozyme M1 (1,4-beta-N-acetylmuramidase)
MAVGYDGNYLTVAETFDGTSWTLGSPQNPGAEDGTNELLGVSCTSSSLCLAVGWFVTDVGPNWQTLAETWTSPANLPVLTITASSTSMTYGSIPPTITAGYSGFVNGDTSVSLTTAPTCSTTATSASPVSGSPYISSCTGAVDPNYQIGYVEGSLTLTPAPTSFTITVNDSSSATITSGNTATLAETGLPAGATGTVTFTSGETVLCTITLPSTNCPTQTSLGAGTYADISGSFSDTDGNYSDSTSTAPVSLTVLAGASGFQGLDIDTGLQGADWTEVADDGYSFAYDPATQGNYYENSAFQTNWNEMVSAGVTPGASLMLDGTISGILQAGYFFSAVGSDYVAGDLIPAVDTSCLQSQLAGESCGTGTGSISVAQAQTVLSAAVSTLTTDFGVAPVIYTDLSFWNQIGDPTGYSADPLWLADYGATAPSGSSLPNGNWYGNGLTLWQYTGTGSVTGIPSAVDLDQSIGALPLDPNGPTTGSAPTVSALTPDTGPVAGGTSVTITGTGFTSESTVDFGSVPASAVDALSTTSIVATSPPGTPGTVYVTVDDSGVYSIGSTVSEFNYTASGSQAQGLDVYAGDGAIDWSDVADAGYTFAYAAATQGTYFTDSQFQTNWNGMVSAGITPGASLRLDGTYSALDQAEYFFDVVGSDYTSGDLVPAIDTSCLQAQLNDESCGTGPPSGSISVAQAQTVLSAAVSALTTDFGVAPVIYTDLSFWNQIGDPAGYGADPLWLADLSANAPSGSSVPANDWYSNDWTLWQYSFTGSVPGIPNAVDLDKSIGALPILTCPLGVTSCASAPGTPTVSAVTPDTGPVAGGTSVTITGTEFTSDSTVDFGSVAASSVDVLSTTSIVATSPPGTPGPVAITVDNSGVLSVWSLAGHFIYTAPASPTPTAFSIAIAGVASPPSSVDSAAVPFGTSATLSEFGLPGGASGTVTFTTGARTLCVVTLPKSSCATSTSLAVGSYPTITATFADTNPNYQGSTSMNTVSLTVLPPPSTKYVTNCQDSGPGSLRDVVANATWGDSIGFRLPTLKGSCHVITLTTESIDLTTNLNIQGPGASTLAVSGDNARTVFVVGNGVTATISGLTINQGSSGNGGGIDNNGTLTVADCTVSDNTATNSTFDDGDGGGIYNNDVLAVTNSTVSDNTAPTTAEGVDGGNGGGIYSDGTLTVTNSTLSGNAVGEVGGAIDNDLGLLTVTDSTLSGNTAGQAGGAIDSIGMLTVTASTLTGNAATPYRFAQFADLGGGAISNSGTANVTASVLSGNTANLQGGAIVNNDTLTVADSTLSGNTAKNVGAAEHVEFSTGGGIFSNSGATLTVADSTLSRNTSGEYGGGILNDGTTSITHGTLSGNGAIFGGGIYGSVTLVATIVAGSSGSNGGDCYGGQVTDGGYNLDDDGTCGLAAANDSLPDTSADFSTGTPGANGGPTPTIALKPGSRAIDHVASESECTGIGSGATDQRGVPWPTPCDIGAIQAGDLDATVVSAPSQIVIGRSLTVTAAVNPSNGGGTVHFSVTLNGTAYGLGHNCLSVALESDKAQCTFTPGTAGTYIVTAVYSGDATYGDSQGSTSVDVTPLHFLPPRLKSSVRGDRTKSRGAVSRR